MMSCSVIASEIPSPTACGLAYVDLVRRMPNILREIASCLATPAAVIISLSLYSGVVLDQWINSSITPVRKLFPPVLVESDVSSIAVTSAIATSSSAVAKRPHDASCLSVVSFNSTKC